MNKNLKISSKILGGLLGVIVGDALGVPVEFVDRGTLTRRPVRNMTGFGTYNQPPGTWSDDSSLTLCLVESLCEFGFDPHHAAQKFVKWLREGYWTPFGVVFDVGGTTREAIANLEKGIPAAEAGPDDERSNGNGSLMRILPVPLYFYKLSPTEIFHYVLTASRITHGHPRSQLACCLYSLLVKEILENGDFHVAYHNVCKKAEELFRPLPLGGELHHFSRFLSEELAPVPEKDILSDGYVVNTLEAATWCLLNTTTFSDAVLCAVNLGGDSDTTGAVAGGLAGVFYGASSIPKEWIDSLIKKDDILALCHRFVRIIIGKN